MNNFKKEILFLFSQISKINLFLSTCLGCFFALFLYLIKFQRNFFSWRYLAFSILIFFGMTFLIILFNHLIIERKYFNLNNHFKISTLLISLFLSTLLVSQIDLEPAFFLLPNHRLRIVYDIGNISYEDSVRFLEFSNRWGSINISTLDIQGSWSQDGKILVFDPNQTIQINWYGKVGPWGNISFKSTNYDQQIDIFWDNEKSVANLFHETETIFYFNNHFILSDWVYLPYVLSVFFLAAYLIHILIILMNSWWGPYPIITYFLSLRKHHCIFAALTAVLLSLGLLVQTHFEPAYFLLPEAQLEILIRIGDLPPDAEGVRLLGLRTRWGYEPFTHLQIDGQYRKEGVNLLFSGNQEVHVRWQGRVGPWAEITFRQTPFDQPVEVVWQGVRSVTNLAHGDQDTISIRQDFRLAWYHFLPYVLSFTITVAYALTALMLLLSGIQYSRKEKRQPAKYAWLLYMLPMLAAWLFTLLVFWPGFMSKDSVNQWYQAEVLQFHNWHPAFHSLIIAILTRIWYTPAIVALVQLVLLALVVAWGLGTLQHYGVPRIVLWGISFLFALSPINNLQVITLWKDIPYAIAVLWMTILLLRIVLSRGATIQRPRDWIILGLAGFCVSIFRKNGYPAAIITLLMLPFIYKTYRKQFTGSLLITVLLYILINGPFYTLMGVNKAGTGQANQILFHHISAHVANKTPLTADERTYLDSILPLEKWNYNCCIVDHLFFDDELDRSTFLMNSQENLRIAAHLFLRAPEVDIKHTLCASELVWRFANNHCRIRDTQIFHSDVKQQTNWIFRNNYGLVTDSVFSELMDDYINLIIQSGFFKDNLVTYLRPALWLFVTIFCTAVLALRRQDARVGIADMLLVLQAIFLFFVLFISTFRYHFSVNLVGLYSLGWLFIGRKRNDDSPASEESSH